MNLSPIKLFKYVKPALVTNSKPLQRGTLSYCDPEAKSIFCSMITSYTGAGYVRTNRSIYDLMEEGTYPAKFFAPSDLNGKDVLDVGTGGGQVVLDLQKRGANPIGIDIHSYPEHSAHPELYKIADAADTKLPEKSYDRIYSAWSIFSFKSENNDFKIKTLIEMKRILKDEGRIRLGALFSGIKELVKKAGELKITAEDVSDSSPRWIELAKIK